jgi:hypothetical protein
MPWRSAASRLRKSSELISPAPDASTTGALTATAYPETDVRVSSSVGDARLISRPRGLISRSGTCLVMTGVTCRLRSRNYRHLFRAGMRPQADQAAWAADRRACRRGSATCTRAFADSARKHRSMGGRMASVLGAAARASGATRRSVLLRSQCMLPGGGSRIHSTSS